MKIACPKCGADIAFDPSSGKLYCEYCGSYSDIKEVELNQYNKEKVKDNSLNQNSNAPSYGATANDGADIYDEFHCSSCGAQLITDKSTTISRCVFCGSQNLLKQRLSGRFEPNKVLPFKITKDRFVNIYKTFVQKKIFAPNEFRNNPFITETRGLYVPFYLYNYDIISYGRGEAQRRSDKTTYYKWFEHQEKSSSLIPVDGSSRLDDSIMSSLEPYNMNELTDFNPAYLTGFQSEKTDETAEALDLKAENRAIMHTKRTIENCQSPYRMTGGYIITDLYKKCDPEFALLPIWFVNCYFKNQKYSYAVNGQTGKVVGEIPLSKSKFYTLMGMLSTVALILTAIILAIFLFSGSSRSRYDDDDDGGSPIMPIILVWVFGVATPYGTIKSRYKNVKHVLSNPIKTWNREVLKDEKYSSKHQYKKKYANDDLNRISFQKYVNGKYAYDININQMVYDSKNILKQNFTVNKEEL